MGGILAPISPPLREAIHEYTHIYNMEVNIIDESILTHNLI
jgi:hypothetical protein